MATDRSKLGPAESLYAGYEYDFSKHSYHRHVEIPGRPDMPAPTTQSEAPVIGWRGSSALVNAAKDLDR